MNLIQELDRLKNEQKVIVDLIRRLENQQDRLQVEELALNHMLNEKDLEIKVESTSNMTVNYEITYDESNDTLTNANFFTKIEIPNLELNPRMFPKEQEEEEEDDDDDKTCADENEKKFTIL